MRISDSVTPRMRRSAAPGSPRLGRRWFFFVGGFGRGGWFFFVGGFGGGGWFFFVGGFGGGGWFFFVGGFGRRGRGSRFVRLARRRLCRSLSRRHRR